MYASLLSSTSQCFSYGGKSGGKKLTCSQTRECNTKTIVVPGLSLQDAHIFVLTIMSTASRLGQKAGVIDICLL
jgi:hypothetical protein